MNICFFNGAKVWGGGENWHLNAALACRSAGHDVTVVSSPKSVLIRRALENGLRTETFNLFNLSFLNPCNVFAIYSFFKRERFDIVVFNFSTDLKNAAYAAKRAGIKRIIYRRGSAIPVKDSLLNRFLFGKCLTDIIANSEETKRTILQNNPELFPEDKIKVIYNGIHLSDFVLGKKIGNDIPVIGNLGRCVPQKRQDILLDIALILKKRDIAFRLIIGGDGPLLDQLKNKAVESGVSDVVTFSGFVDDPAHFMQSIDIFALTSEWEGFGYVITEAMACEDPVVAFDISSNPELISNGKSGCLVPFDDRVAFADALEDLIKEPKKRTDFGKAGMKIVEEKFDFDKNMKDVVAFLMGDNDNI